MFNSFWNITYTKVHGQMIGRTELILMSLSLCEGAGDKYETHALYFNNRDLHYKCATTSHRVKFKLNTFIFFWFLKFVSHNTSFLQLSLFISIINGWRVCVCRHGLQPFAWQDKMFPIFLRYYLHIFCVCSLKLKERFGVIKVIEMKVISRVTSN